MHMRSVAVAVGALSMLMAVAGAVRAPTVIGGHQHQRASSASSSSDVVDYESMSVADMAARWHRPSLYSTFVGNKTVVFAGKAGDDSLDTQKANGALFNKTMNALQPGDIFVVPAGKMFYVMGGILVHNISDVTLAFDGDITYSKSRKDWPRTTPGKKGHVMACMHILNAKNLRITSSQKLALLDGNGAEWWGFPGIGYLEIGENRPRMLTLDHCTDCLVEHLYFKNSPYWTFWAPSSQNLEVRNCNIQARRDKDDGHDIIDITAFNTDGYDFSGDNVYIHDCTVWNQDDCVCAKDGSTNVLVERITASGLGITIGSIGNSKNDNITFRDITMDHTVKGIYMKFRGSGGSVTNVLYENVTMNAVEQWPIWIGPAQQSDSSDLCAAHPCSICWPLDPFAKCNTPASLYANITLRNILVNGSKNPPGVIIANKTMPMQGVTFDNVVVKNYKTHPFKNYDCENVHNGIATGGTTPVPPCFKEQSN